MIAKIKKHKFCIAAISIVYFGHWVGGGDIFERSTAALGVYMLACWAGAMGTIADMYKWTAEK